MRARTGSSFRPIPGSSTSARAGSRPAAFGSHAPTCSRVPMRSSVSNDSSGSTPGTGKALTRAHRDAFRGGFRPDAPLPRARGTRKRGRSRRVCAATCRRGRRSTDPDTPAAQTGQDHGARATSIPSKRLPGKRVARRASTRPSPQPRSMKATGRSAGMSAASASCARSLEKKAARGLPCRAVDEREQRESGERP